MLWIRTGVSTSHPRAPLPAVTQWVSDEGSRARQHPDDPARDREELAELDALVDRVGELDAARARHRARDAAGGEVAHVRAPRHAGGPDGPAELVLERAGHERDPRVVRGGLGG